MVRLRESVSCERVGDSWLVLSDRDGVVHNLTGPAATVIDCVTTGQPIPPDCNDAVATLVDTGILTAPTGWSRRKVLTTAAAAAAIGMVTVTLPTAAMAASVSPFGAVTATAGSNQVTINWTAAASTSYQVFYKATLGAGDYVNFGGSVAAGSVVVTGLTNATEYSFKVQVVGSSPLIESAAVTSTPFTAIANLGTTWTAATATGLNDWNSVAYGNGVWVAVSTNGTNRVMYSTNGVTWTNTGITGVVANSWMSVAYGNGVWVAVAFDKIDGTNQVMTSPDGITWTNTGITGVAANQWMSVAYGSPNITLYPQGVWVAVAQSGANRVMYSTNNGVTWSPGAGAEAIPWYSVAYGNGVWVAVASFDGDNRVMRSTDGASWTNTGITGVVANEWYSVAYGSGVWVAVASAIGGDEYPVKGPNRVMRSINNGVTWSAVSAAEANHWNSVAYGNGVWVAVASTVAATGPNRVMTSTDNGATWSAVAAAAANDWFSVAYGNGKFVSVAFSGDNRVMYSPAAEPS